MWVLRKSHFHVRCFWNFVWYLYITHFVYPPVLKEMLTSDWHPCFERCVTIPCDHSMRPIPSHLIFEYHKPQCLLPQCQINATQCQIHNAKSYKMPTASDKCDTVPSAIMPNNIKHQRNATQCDSLPNTKQSPLNFSLIWVRFAYRV